ncbi:hypothetical protein AAY473_000763 [Plecturocebus cupreus]
MDATEIIASDLGANESPDLQHTGDQKTPKETGSHSVDQAGLKLLVSSDPPSLASHMAGLTGKNHHTWPWEVLLLCVFLLVFLPCFEMQLHHVDQARLILLTSDMVFHHVGQACLKLLTSGYLPALLSRSTGESHHPWPKFHFLINKSVSKEMLTGRFLAEEPHGSPARLFRPARLFCRCPSVALLGAEYTGRTGSAGPIPTRKTAIGSAED